MAPSSAATSNTHPHIQLLAKKARESALLEALGYGLPRNIVEFASAETSHGQLVSIADALY